MSETVYLGGPGPFGFRLYGGRGEPLKISKIRVGSKAFEADLREGDVVRAINGQNCSELSQAQAMNIVDTAESLNLEIVRNDTGGPGSVVYKKTQNNNKSLASVIASDAMNYHQQNSHQNNTPHNYSRHEQTSRDGNTTSKTVTETEQYGGTTLTRVKRERTSEWNNGSGSGFNDFNAEPWRPSGGGAGFNSGGGGGYNDLSAEPWRPRSTTPREEVLRTTSAGFRQQDRVPANPERREMTVDLEVPGRSGPGRNTSDRTTTETQRFGGTTLTRVTRERNSDWSNGLDSEPWMQRSATPREEVFRTTSAGFRMQDTVPANPGKVQMTLDLGKPDSRDFGSNTNLLTSNSSSSNKQDPWSPGQSNWERDLGNLTVDTGSYARKAPSPQNAGRSVWNTSKHEPSRPYDLNSKLDSDISNLSQQYADNSFTSENILFKWNSGGQQLHNSSPGNRQEAFRTTGAKVNRAPTPVTFDLGKPWEESKENYAPGRNYTQPTLDPLSWEFDLSSSNNSTLNREPKKNSTFSTPTNTWKSSNQSRPADNSPSYSGVTSPPRQSGSLMSPRMNKFDSDKGYVDPLSLDDLDALAKFGSEPSRDWKASRNSDRKMNYPDLPPDINKILSAPKDVVEDPASVVARQRIADGGAMQEKKVFGDSSFYAGSKHNYPTVEEQVKMARIVAHSLTSDANLNARGHQMFLKRRERADKYAVDSSISEKKPANHLTGRHDDDPYYNPTPWNLGKTWQSDGKPADSWYGGSSIPPPPPLPTSLLFAPRGEDKSRALTADEFERVRLYDQKTKHDTVSPQVCFNLARDLKENKGKGGRMFAKRRARAEQYTVEGEGHGPDPSVMMKIVSGHARDNPAPRPINDAVSSRYPDNKPISDSVDYGAAPPVNRLQKMIEIPKAKMTPWDAMAEFGHVDPAFEHLRDLQFVGKNNGTDVISSSASGRMTGGYQQTQGYGEQPGWAKSTTSNINSINTDFSSRSSFSANFTPKLDFSAKSSSGYRPVQFSGSFPNHAGGGLTAGGSGPGYSEL